MRINCPRSILKKFGLPQPLRRRGVEERFVYILYFFITSLVFKSPFGGFRGLWL